MFRKFLLQRLLSHPMTVVQLGQELRADPKEIELDLRHLMRSLRNTSYRIRVVPSECRHCHFAFRKDKLRKPGKCPICKGTWVTEPRIGIERD